MSLGSLYLKFRQKYGHGLEVAHYRDRVRPKILKTPPITNTTDKTCEIHVLTSANDWLNLIWGLKSLYYYTGRNYALCIHGDTSLTEEQEATFREHFPNARVISRSEADKAMFEFLKPYPRCLEFRKTNHLSPKVFDFTAYLDSDRMFLFDSDILFFSEPTELLARLESPDYQKNSVNADVGTAYTIDPEIVKEKMGFEVIPRFNSGLGIIHKDSMNLEWIEEFLNLPDIVGHFWRIEQTMFALCSSRFGVELLPSAYDVHLEGDLNGSPSRHYVGAIRHKLYGEGIKQLVKQGFLKALGEGGIK
jgi:hypothetical protein